MKKILGFLILGALIAFGCNKEKEYEPAQPESGAQFFFPVGTATNYTIAEDVTGYDFTVRRIVKDDAANVTIAVTDTSKTIFPDGFGEIVASFAAGESETVITLPVNYSKYEFGDKIGVDLEISRETTLYAPSSLHIELLLPEPWVLLGNTGTWVSSWLWEATFEDVEFYQNQVQPNHFRFAYAKALVFNLDEDCPEDKDEREEYWEENREDWIAEYPEFFEFWILKPGDKVMYGTNVLATITMENLVTWDPMWDTGVFYTGYEDIYAMYPAMFTSYSSEADYLANSKVVSYQEDKPELPAVVELAPSYYMPHYGGWASTAASANVTLVFPGIILADYSVDVEYSGLMTTKDNDIYAFADVTLGDDVEYAKVAIVAGKNEDALNEAFDLILSGEESDYVTTIQMSETKPVEIEDEEAEDETKIIHVGEIRLPLPEDIDEFYSFVIVPFAADKAQERDAAYSSFQYKDFGVALTLADPVTGDDGLGHITATIEFGADTEGAFAVLAPGNDEASLYAALNLILGGDDSVVFTDKPGDLTFDIEGEGDFLVMVASYAEGDLWNLDYKTFEYFAVDPWETMGYILYTDDLLGPLFQAPPVSYWVPIQKNTTSEGLYRLMNPYHEAFPYNGPGDYDDSKDHNIVIDATDPDVVVIPTQYTGADWGYGEMYILSLGQYYLDYGYSVAQIIAGAGDIFGKLADGKITFAAKTLMVGDDDDVYVPSASQGLVLDLNDIRETAPASAPLKFMPKKSARGKATVNAKASIKSLGAPQFPKTLKREAVQVAKGKVSAMSKNSKPVFTGRK